MDLFAFFASHVLFSFVDSLGYMNSEQHRRLIGNDVVFVIFHDSDQMFDPNPLDTLGTVPHIFAVVQPYEDSFR